jgi:hypothetical protein
MARERAVCEWLSLHEALTAFVRNVSGHQGAGHIKPLHWYVACRLVLEGGFRPEEITPRPPFRVREAGRRLTLEYDAAQAGSGEAIVLGGLKTKAVDVVVNKDGIGPCVAVSMKGTLNAFRNLTNRMEEAVGDCTNLHIAYPALVYGFLHVLRANREASGVEPNDVAIHRNGETVDSILRYHDVLARLADRDDVRSEVSKYEAVALALVGPDPPSVGQLVKTFPKPDSSLLLGSFFARLYRAYDLRFVYAAPALKTTTQRLEWDEESPVFQDARIRGFEPRVANPED